MRIANDCIVSLNFTLHNESGQLLDSSPDGQPLTYLHGHEGVLPALQRALAGLASGERFDVTLPPDQAFGPRVPGLTERVPRSNWPQFEQLAVGMQVEGSNEQGDKRSFVISAMDADTVTLDGNHPLAGMTLRFQGTVIDVREAAAEDATTH
ncbi:MAG: peptidylprolyl isomerase [Gammaproteobacteria bacterium]